MVYDCVRVSPPSPRHVRVAGGSVVGVAVLCATVAIPQQAADPAAELFLDLSTGFEATDNYEYLEEPSGGTYLWATDAVIGYSSETGNQAFSAELGGRLAVGEYAEDEDENGGFINPFLSLDYAITGVGSAFETSFLIRERENGIDVQEISNSTDLIIDQGTRRDMNFAARLALGEDAPVSFEGEVALDRRRYIDSEDPDLTDQDLYEISTELGFAVTRTARLLVVADYYDRDDVENVKSDETNARFGLGLSAEIDPTLTFRGTISHSFNQKTETISGDRVSTEQERPTIDLSLTQDRPNAEHSVSLQSELDNAGLRTTLSFGRSTDLRSGQLAYSLGATRTEEGDVNPVGSIDWTRDYRDSTFAMGFENGVRTDDDDDLVVFSRLSMDFVKEVTPVSGFRANLAASASRNIEDDDLDARQASIGISYFRDLDRNWSLVAGYNYRVSVDQDDDETITANKVYATIDRRFSLRP